MTTFDLLISGGTVHDGTGAAGLPADVGVTRGRIAAVGDLDESDATETIDATGRVVTPGFVDVHTHLDAQIGWEPTLKSACYHGVTTVLLGNCGVTFAPAKAENRQYLAELMEAVEDIDAEAIMDGLPWTWTSYGEYLDALQELRPALNVTGLVGHSPIRFDAMGDRSMDEGEQPTDEELAVIVDHVRQSMADGAVGFSTSRFLGHRVPDGRCTPGTYADSRETGAIQQAIVDGGGVGGLFQVVPDFQTRGAEDLAMLERGADLGCRVLFSGGVGPKGDGGFPIMADFLDRNNGAGRSITTLSHTRPSGGLWGVSQLCPYRTPAWQELMSLPTIDDRYEAMQDPATRDRLIAEGIETPSRIPPEVLHPLGSGDTPDYDLDGLNTVASIAADRGCEPVEVFVDFLLATQGRGLMNMWMFGGNTEPLWKYHQMEHCIPLLGDAGAHVGQIIDADSTTFLLAELTRRRGLFTLPGAIRKLTSQGAELLGLQERGQIRPGWHADLNVIDFENLETLHPEYHNDFPHGGGRFVVKSRGYDATVVGGEVVVRHGELTGSQPGEVIREFARG